MRDQTAILSLLLALGLGALAAAAPDTGPGDGATTGPGAECEYKVAFGARDPFVAARPAAAREPVVKVVPQAGGAIPEEAGRQLAAIAEQVQLQGIAAGPGGVDLAILNGALVKVGDPFTIRGEAGEVQLRLLAIRKNPPQVTVRWGQYDFVRSIGTKGEGP